MASGGARNRSEPPPDPNSGRSDRRGVTLSALPTSYTGPVPDFPLPDESVRESEVWAQAWQLPQANAWALPSESWRVRTVAMWVRLSVRCEDVEAGAALYAQLHRFADQIGLTTAGLTEMGWRVATEDEPAVSPAAQPRRQERRLRAVSGDAQ